MTNIATITAEERRRYPMMHTSPYPGDHASPIHPTAFLEGTAEIADGADVGPLCYLRGPLAIGARTRIYPHACIGTDGEHKRREPAGTVRIGADCIIREGVAVQRGTGLRDTSVGDRVWLMHNVHVAHDCEVGDDVTISPNVVLGGETIVHRGATLGIGCMTHQGTTIGAYAMIGMGAVVTRDVPPFCLVVGNPARFVRLNTKGIEAAGIAPECVWVERGRVMTIADKAAEHMRAFARDSKRAPMVLP